MTSANAMKRSGLFALLLAGSTIGFPDGVSAQSTADSNVAATGSDQDTNTSIDRETMRLELLIRLVENELNEAELLQSRLTVEATGLDQERRAMESGPSDGTIAEQRQLDVIEERLQQIDQEMATVNARLPEIKTELGELQARLDKANGVVREVGSNTALNGPAIDGASQWLDSKRRVQEALVYLGGYNALIDGDFGPRTAEAVRVYQGRQNAETTGTLTDDQEEALLAEADLLRMRYGMKTIEDSEGGYRLSYPSGLLPDGGLIGQIDRRFTSKDGRGELLITSSEESSAAGFTSLFEQLLTEYEVQYRRQRPDWFVVAGLVEDGRIAYDTARLSGNRIVRARLSYPAELRDLWSPFAVIMFNSFEAISADAS